mmetsp:Transcript_87229/g.154520  ORF Transcript_87229/g.154520 Transcript_87229/m.154520 type:complete len:256 (-) Transcript_87229:1888-2655(-)
MMYLQGSLRSRSEFSTARLLPLPLREHQLRQRHIQRLWQLRLRLRLQLRLRQLNPRQHQQPLLLRRPFFLLLPCRHHQQLLRTRRTIRMVHPRWRWHLSIFRQQSVVLPWLSLQRWRREWSKRCSNLRGASPRPWHSSLSWRSDLPRCKHHRQVQPQLPQPRLLTQLLLQRQLLLPRQLQLLLLRQLQQPLLLQRLQYLQQLPCPLRHLQQLQRQSQQVRLHLLPRQLLSSELLSLRLSTPSGILLHSSLHTWRR